MSLLPTLAEAQLVPVSELEAYGESEGIISLMAQLQLGCYRREGDTFWWIGSASPLLHDHERWFFRFSKNVLQMRNSFKGIMADLIDTCQRSAAAVLFDELGDINGWVQHSAIALGLELPLTPEQLASWLALFASFGYMQKSYLRQVHADVLQWRPDLHELLYHEGTYRVQHPESGALPRALLLRLHGLGAYVELEQAGENLLY